MKIVVATWNRHKITELSRIFYEHQLILPEDIDCKNCNVLEDGNSFFENAHIKATSLFKKTNLPCIADDSGLCVQALQGQPGIHSARFGNQGGVYLDSESRNQLLLDTMQGKIDRICHFTCCMVAVLEAERYFAVQEIWAGQLLDTACGTGGFGYDPVVYIPALGKSVAELSLEEKIQYSHRGRAGTKLSRLLKITEKESLL